MDRATIALLIDADNAPASKIGLILNDLATYGECNIRRAYGNWTKSGLKGWIAELHDSAIRPMQQFDLTTQKNASDMALAIDAVDLLHTGRPDAFAIVSSDSDFTPLVHYLREHGAAVYGYGREKTPTPFQSACTRFTVLEQLGDADDADDADVVDTDAQEAGAVPAKGTAKKAAGKKAATGRRSSRQVPAEKLRSDGKLVGLLRNAIGAAAGEDGWALVNQVGSQIRNQSSLDWRNYGYSTLTKLLLAMDLFDLRGEGTPQVAVRDPKAR